jgi:hypothetical protein
MDPAPPRGMTAGLCGFLKRHMGAHFANANSACILAKSLVTV